MNYQNAYPPRSITLGESLLVFDAETPAPPQASAQAALASAFDNTAPSISVEISFSGDPGAFEIDIQDADTDADKFYQTIPAGGVISAVSANFTARTELVPIKGRFVRLKLVTRTNAVALTAKISR